MWVWGCCEQMGWWWDWECTQTLFWPCQLAASILPRLPETGNVLRQPALDEAVIPGPDTHFSSHCVIRGGTAMGLSPWHAALSVERPGRVGPCRGSADLGFLPAPPEGILPLRALLLVGLSCWGGIMESPGWIEPSDLPAGPSCDSLLISPACISDTAEFLADETF